jgi:UDP-N-acetylmuramate-alanine ligase
LLDQLTQLIKSGDLVIFMGAGDIYKMAKDMLPKLING